MPRPTDRRIAPALLAAVIGLSPSLGLADEDPAATPAAPPIAADPAKEILAYYPPAALAAKTAGEATITCGQDIHLVLINCSLVSEAPAGQGFGAAALSIASRSAGAPWIKLDQAPKTPRVVTITFTPEPTTIKPNLLAPMPKGPVWLARPDPWAITKPIPARRKSCTSPATSSSTAP